MRQYTPSLEQQHADALSLVWELRDRVLRQENRVSQLHHPMDRDLDILDGLRQRLREAEIDVIKLESYIALADMEPDTAEAEAA